MKSLAHLLSGPEEAISSQADLDTESEVAVKVASFPALPPPMDFSKLYHHHCLRVDSVLDELPRLVSARRDLEETRRLPLLRCGGAEGLRTANLLDYAAHFCPGVDLQAELVNNGGGGAGVRRRRRELDDMEATIQHKRRRKGQASDIIQTGRSAKKYGG